MRIFSSIFILSTCVLLVGFNRLITGAIRLGIPRELVISIELMVAQVSKQLVELGRLVIAKSSRLFSRKGLLEEYGILSQQPQNSLLGDQIEPSGFQQSSKVGYGQI